MTETPQLPGDGEGGNNLPPRKYPNSDGEDYRAERDRLVGAPTTRDVGAILLHREELLLLRRLMTCIAKDGEIEMTVEDRKTAALLKYELDGIKVRAQPLKERKHDDE